MVVFLVQCSGTENKKTASNAAVPKTRGRTRSASIILVRQTLLRVPAGGYLARRQMCTVTLTG